MHKHVLIITSTLPPTGGPGIQRVLKFIRYLPAEGWRVTVLAGDSQSSGIWGDRDKKDYSLCDEIPQDVKVIRIKWRTIEIISSRISHILAVSSKKIFPWLKVTEVKKSLEWRLISFFYFFHPEPMLEFIVKGVSAGLKLHKTDDFKIIFTSGPPHNVHFIGLLLKFLLRKKWVADFRDPWTESLSLEPKKVTVSAFLNRYKEKVIIKKSDILLTVSDSWKELLCSKLNCFSKSKVKLVHNGYDSNDLPIVIKPEKIDNILHFHHNGTLYERRNCRYLFQSIYDILTTKSDCKNRLKFTFTGLSKSATEQIAKFGIKNVVYDIGRLPHIESLRYSSRCDILLLMSDAEDKSSAGAMSGKVYEYIALGKPILALLPRSGNLEKFLIDYQHAIMANYSDVTEIMSAILHFFSTWENKQLCFCDPPAWIKRYSRSEQTKQLANIMNELATHK